MLTIHIAIVVKMFSMCLQDAGSSQVGFLLGSCGVGLALTSEICLKGLPKTPTGEILQFKGQRLHTCKLHPFIFKSQSVMRNL